MIAYSIQQISEVLGGELIKASGGKISYLLIDSRKILFARESLFFALSGSRMHGSYYLADCYKAGVRNFVVEQFPEKLNDFPRANFLKVSSSFRALQKLVSWHRTQFDIPVIGVTGSNGKTIVKEWIHQSLSHEKYVIRNPKSYNSQVGVPLSVWLLNSDAELGVFEAGISLPNEMEVLETIIQPSIGIFTNLGDAHQENFESTSQKLEEKLKLFKNCSLIIYNSDNKLVDTTIRATFQNKDLFSWSYSKTANLQIIQQRIDKDKTHIQAIYKNESISIQIPFIDKASVENAIHVWSLLLYLNIDREIMRERLKNLEPVGMRLELKEGLNHCTIINDSYNSDLESLHIALDFLSYQNQHATKVLILSDIAQSGYKKSDLYRLVANAIKQKSIDRLIGVGADISEFQAYFEIRKDFFSSTQQVLEHLAQLKLKNSAILLKGARQYQFEEISKKLEKQSHRTVFEIDLNALEYNLNYFKNLLQPSTGIIAMLKASSYGSGTYEIANICQYHRVAAIAVAFTDEGIELRKSGIKIPIMVMNPEDAEFPSIVAYNLEPEIYDFNSLQAFNNFLEKENIEGYPVHLKVDTGMNRAGFLPSDIAQLIAKIALLKGLKIKTVFSHLASADEPEQDVFTKQQFELYEAVTSQLQKVLNYKFKRHILNSAGIERFPEHQYDLVRLGIGMYGVSAVNAPLAQVGTLSTSVVQVKKVKKGETVGYGRVGIAKSDIEIATIPIGYADGLRRILSNGTGKLWINGNLVPIIGNVCMDLCMVEITNLGIKPGDKVEVFGKNLSLTKIATWMQTIPYEVLTGISRRVKRTYHYE